MKNSVPNCSKKLPTSEGAHPPSDTFLHHASMMAGANASCDRHFWLQRLATSSLKIVPLPMIILYWLLSHLCLTTYQLLKSVLTTALQFALCKCLVFSSFCRKPVGKYHIQICMTTPCLLRDSTDIMDTIKRKLGRYHHGSWEDMVKYPWCKSVTS